jgi:hypothetical protein
MQHGELRKAAAAPLLLPAPSSKRPRATADAGRRSLPGNQGYSRKRSEAAAARGCGSGAAKFDGMVLLAQAMRIGEFPAERAQRRVLNFAKSRPIEEIVRASQIRALL